VAGVLPHAREAQDRVLVLAALHDAVDLDGTKAHGIRRRDACENRFGPDAAAVHALEDFVFVAVEAHGDALQAGGFEFVRLLFQQVAVGGEGKVAQAFERGESFDQARQLVTQQRFTAGDADLLDAELHEQPRQPLDLLEGQQLRPRQEFVVLAVDLGGHAVRAAEVAAVRDGDAQVVQRAAAGVRNRGHEFPRIESSPRSLASHRSVAFNYLNLK
jgi:hypothetical protein